MGRDQAGEASAAGRDDHYRKTLDNFALIGSENLHFVGYFEHPEDTLVSALDNLNGQLARRAAVDEHDLVLDIGCGSGGPACALAERTGCRVVGVDIGQAQLEQARALAAEKGVVDLVRFEHGDAARLPFEERQFDAALMIGVASNVPDRDALFAGAARVLKANGRLVLGDAVMNDPAWFRDRGNAMPVKVVQTFFGSPRIGTLDEYHGLFQRHGFRLDHSEDLKPHVTRSSTLWTRALEERRDEVVERLGKSRYRGLVKGIGIVNEVVGQGRFTFVLLRATRQA